MNTQVNLAHLKGIALEKGNTKTVSRAAWKGTAFRAALGLSLTALPGLHLQAQNPLLPPPPIVSTIHANGDVNPYGVAFVPAGFLPGGTTQTNDILVSNFNNAQNLQGTGTTIIKVAMNGQVSLFFQGKAPLGLTAALGVAQAGFIFVGNMPTADGTSATVQPGSLLVLNNQGQLLGALGDQYGIDGPWGMAIHDLGEHAQLFISNVLSGVVIRIDVVLSSKAGTVQIRDSVKISSGYSHRPDPAALELGPSGLAYDAVHDILYVADSADNTIRAITGAGALTSDVGPGVVIYRTSRTCTGRWIWPSAPTDICWWLIAMAPMSIRTSRARSLSSPLAASS